jgi:hypothetical protein
LSKGHPGDFSGQTAGRDRRRVRRPVPSRG